VGRGRRNGTPAPPRCLATLPFASLRRVCTNVGRFLRIDRKGAANLTFYKKYVIIVKKEKNRGASPLGI
jgi:hypothetical protein